MRDIAALLLDGDPDRLIEFLAAGDARGRGREPGARQDRGHTDDGYRRGGGCLEGARPGDWCQTPPGHADLRRLAMRLGGRGR